MEGSGFDGIDPHVLISPLSELPVLEDIHDNNQPIEDLHYWLSWCTEDEQPSRQDTVSSSIDVCVGFQASPELLQTAEMGRSGMECYQDLDHQMHPPIYAPGALQTRRERRRAQNRSAQKAYRDRKDQHVQMLEAKIKELEIVIADLTSRGARQENVIDHLTACSTASLKALTAAAPEDPTCRLPSPSDGKAASCND